MALRKRHKMDDDDPDKFAPMTKFESQAIDSANTRAINEDDPEYDGNRMAELHRCEGSRIDEGFQMLSESEDRWDEDDDSDSRLISNQ